MAIGETIVGTLWASFAGICVEKLLDELLKVNRRSRSEWKIVVVFLEWNQSETIDRERIGRCCSDVVEFH